MEFFIASEYEDSDQYEARTAVKAARYAKELRNSLPRQSAAALLLSGNIAQGMAVLQAPPYYSSLREMTPLMAAVVMHDFVLVSRLLQYKFIIADFVYQDYRISNATAYTTGLFFNHEAKGLEVLADEAGPPLSYQKIGFPVAEKRWLFACQLGGAGDEQFAAIAAGEVREAFSDYTDFTGMTLLMWACYNRSEWAVYQKLGFQAGRKDAAMKTAMQYAVEANNFAAVEFLSQFEDEVNSIPDGQKLTRPYAPCV